MLRQRLIIALLIVSPGLFCIIQGGLFYFSVLLLVFALAAYEYTQMMQKNGNRPAGALIMSGTLALVFVQSAPGIWPALEAPAALLSGGTLLALVIAATAWHLVDFERGAPASAIDWAITLAGMIYLGWGSGYFMRLRALPDGLWWTFVVLPPIWLADSGAYVVGKAWGKHLLAPRLSPKKTWEGLAGGIGAGVVFGAICGWLGSLGAEAGSGVGAASGALLGLVVSVMSVVGDLAISMLKRQMGVKDTSSLLGAHGGLLDRIDSWLIAGPVAYFVIVLFFNFPD